MARANIVDRDKGYRELLKKVADRKMRLAVGVPLTAPKGQIASYLHDGTSRMPARPFLSQWVDKYRSRSVDIIFQGYKAVVKREIPSYRMALERFIGPALVLTLRAEMASGNYAPLAPSTIRRKGSSLPLVDTGELVGDAQALVKQR